MFEDFKENYSGLSLALGFFDGVHIAHKDVILNAVNFAKENNTKSAIITFNNHPAELLGRKIQHITTIEQRNRLITQLGVDYIFSLDFSEKTLNTTDKEYLEQLHNNFKPLAITTGFNHTFGKMGKGTPQTLKDNQTKYSYKYFQIPAKKINDEIVSSSAIRTKLLSGNIKSANLMLGREFEISGEVTKGAQLGRKIGFPTANIIYPQNFVQIPYGVYTVEVDIQNNHYSGVMNFGIKPTINNNEQTPLAEVHIIGFNQDIYGKNIVVRIKDFIRPEQKFGSLDELKTQIEKDLQACLKL